MNKKLMGLLAGLLALGLCDAVQATLIDRGNGLVYDDVLDITWLQDANYCRTNPADLACIAAGADAFGSMAWDNAVAWADELVFGGVDNWRLASVSVAAGLPTGATNSVVDCSVVMELACRDNELAYMYYHNLGGTSGDDLSGDQESVDGVELLNIEWAYWSGTELASNPTFKWTFEFYRGRNHVGATVPRISWAVRPGDIAAVPEPTTLLLMGLGLAGIGYKRRRSKIAA